MKLNIKVILILILLITQLVFAQEVILRVDSNSEFTNALESNRTIILTNDEFVFPDRIKIKGYNNLSIIGKKLTKIIVENRKSTVISFINCDSLYLENLYIGHQQSPVHGCNDKYGTVMFRNCNFSTINNSTFYGCGKVGFKMYICNNVSFNNLMIKDCTEALFAIFDSRNIQFNDSKFKDTYMFTIGQYLPKNFKYSMIQIDNSFKIRFSECNFHDNIQSEGNFIHLDSVSDSIQFCNSTFKNNISENFTNSGIDLENTKFIDNAFQDITTNVTIVYNNEEIDLNYAAARLGIEEIQILIEKGANVNQYSDKKKHVKHTPLYDAVKNRKLENAEYLLKNGADIYQKSFEITDGYDIGYNIETVLHIATAEFLKQIQYRNINYNVLDYEKNTPLHRACLRRSLEDIKFLINNGININQINKLGTSALHIAASTGDLAITQYLIDNGADVNTHTPKGQSPLHRAVINYRESKNEDDILKTVGLLIRNGADLDYVVNIFPTNPNPNFVSPIQHAMFYKQYNVAYFLYKSGAKINIDSENWTILHDLANEGVAEAIEDLKKKNCNLLATRSDSTSLLLGMSRFNNFQMVKYLVEHGAKINAIPQGKSHSSINNSALTEACLMGNYEIAQYLIENGAIINMHNRNKKTPLICASQEGFVNIVKLLIINGAEIDQGQYYSGSTPLLYAISNNHIEVAEVLIQHGANHNISVNKGSGPFGPPLTEAILTKNDTLIDLILSLNPDTELRYREKLLPIERAILGEQFHTIKKLIIYGAKLDDIQIKFKYALTNIASRFGDLEFLISLKNQGFDLNHEAKFFKQKNPILLSASHGHLNIIKYLLNGEFKINSNMLNNTLTNAASHGFTEIVDLLIANGADINDSSRSNYSSFSLAALNCRVETMKYLYEHGADINCQSPPYKSPLDRAKDQNNTEVIELLKNWGANE